MISDTQGLPLEPLEEIRDLLHFRGLDLRPVKGSAFNQSPSSLEKFLSSGDFLKDKEDLPGKGKEVVYLLEPFGQVEVSPAFGLSQVELLSEGIELLTPVRSIKLQASQDSGKELLRGLLTRQGFKNKYLMDVKEEGQDLIFELEALPVAPEDPSL